MGNSCLKNNKLFPEKSDSRKYKQCNASSLKAYLISITTTDADLCHIPDVCVITGLAPHFAHEPGEALYIDIKCSNGTAIHVIPKLKA